MKNFLSMLIVFIGMCVGLTATATEPTINSNLVCTIEENTIPWIDVPYEFTGQIALAALDYKGRHVIAFDKKMVLEQPESIQQHIAAHECAHIMLGHVDVGVFKTMIAYEGTDKATLLQQQEKRENEADCKAVELLVQQKNWTRGHFFTFFGALKNTPMPQQHINHRIFNTMQCSAFPAI